MDSGAKLTERSAGVLLHVTSLPGRYGIGDLGPEARRWVDLLARAKQTWWQMLPLGPAGAGDSPYQCFSAFAGNPVLVSPELLVREGLLRRGDVSGGSARVGRVDYPRVNTFKSRLLGRAFERFRGGAGRALRGGFEQFCRAEGSWLDDFAVFMAIKENRPGVSWVDWPKELVFRNRGALDSVRRDLRETVDRQRFVQFLFFRQLDGLKQYARRKGIRLIGDLPIYVSGESADVWAWPELFLLGRDRRPTSVAGVPPDMFSKTGQRWGNPLYNWPAMKRRGYAWWVARARAALRQADLVRIDHFRGFAGYWKVPADAPTAEHGRWVKGPGRELFDVLRRELGGLPFIAEDLGVITPDVEALRDGLGLPGMRVLQFGFGGGAENPYLPHNYVRNVVAYTGTHDNDTTAGWYRSLGRTEGGAVRRYVPEVGKDPAGALLRLAWSSVAAISVAPLQDVLGLGSEARMNLPGSAKGNWRWRLRAWDHVGQGMDRLGEITGAYGRA